MHPADLARRERDPGAGGGPRQPGGDPRGAPERVERGTKLDEPLPAGRFGGSRSARLRGVRPAVAKNSRKSARHDLMAAMVLRRSPRWRSKKPDTSRTLSAARSSTPTSSR